MEVEVALLVVDLGGRLCGFRCSEVLEVLPRVKVTPLPDSPPEVIGVINARGHVVRVVDPRARLGGSTATPFQYLVLLGTVAVAVDQVREVVRVRAEDVSGVVRVGGDLVVTLGAGDVFHGER